MPTRLKVARINRGLSVAEVAREMGVDRRTLERAEAGLPVREGPAKKIAEYWGLKAIDIFEEPVAA